MLPLQTSTPLAILVRFLRYNVIGVSTFLLDLALIWLFTFNGLLPELPAVGVGFVIAASLNYGINRWWAFRGTKRDVLHGYGFFLCIISAALLLTLAGTHALLELTGWPLLLVRVLVGALVGGLNFLAQSFITFRMF